MVNNYVKHGHVAKPIKKKYNAAQVARLIVITSLKTVFEISEIAKTWKSYGQMLKVKRVTTITL